MINTIRTDSTNRDFIDLVKSLDDYLTVTDGNEHGFYDQYNKLDKIKHVVVVYENDQPIACGAMKYFNDQSMEIKRMYTLPVWRGKGIASGVLAELENWARELKYEKCVLETGKRQTEAVELYKRRGYKIIPNYGQYVGIENSVCFEKLLQV
ncbi:MAG: GNAT family N-acetyltransferase [Bacteroidetes bacterium]|nr:MAG: GNAT family N-acetyltransferase [Bacteroidota bacterium]